MNRGPWDTVLDDIELAIDTVERALASGDPVPVLTGFVPPRDVMPPMSPSQRSRADGLMRRQANVEVRVSAEIVSAQLDLGEVRRRRRAALAYSRA